MKISYDILEERLKGGLQKMEKDKLIQAKGITLVALVITTIVLLLLTGVSISALLGESRIDNKN